MHLEIYLDFNPYLIFKMHLFFALFYGVGV
jgi:hypothetical protein